MKPVSSTIIAIVCVLTVIGLVMVASTSLLSARSLDDAVFLKRQLVWVGLALAAMLLVMRIDYHVLARLSPWILAAVVLLLAAVLVPDIGFRHNGARRWIRFLGFGIQPSEMAKFAVVLFISAWLSQNADRIRTLRYGFLPVLIVTMFIAGLVLVEPDFGTAVLIVAVGMIIAVLAGVRLLHMAPFVAPAGLMVYCAVFLIKYRYERVLAFLDPWKYRDAVGYQLCQALVALGSGGLTGVGLGQSAQKRDFLPEAIHDFAFAVLGEEMGLVGTLLVVVLFAALVWYGMRVARHAPDLLGFLIAGGVTTTIGLQALLNIAVVTGSVPTKGISLPFVSFGGSSLFFLMSSIGLLLSVARRSERVEVAPVDVQETPVAQ